MLLERGTHGLGLALPDPRRPDDVGEEERGDAGGQRDRRDPLDARGEQIGPLVEDGAFELDGLGPGRDAELLAEPLAELAERAERVGLPTGAVLGEHQVTPQPLVERVLGDEALGLREHAVEVAELEPEPEQVLAGAEPDLLEPLPRRERPLREAGVEQRLAPPAGERGLEDAGRGLGLGSRERPAVGDLVGEDRGVDLVVGTDDEAVAHARPVLDPLLAEGAAEVRHVALDRLGRARRRRALPEVLAQPVDGDEGVRVDEQAQQERPSPGALDLGVPVRDVSDLQRTEDSVVHVPPAPRGAADRRPAGCATGPSDGAPGPVRPACRNSQGRPRMLVLHTETDLEVTMVMVSERPGATAVQQLAALDLFAGADRELLTTVAERSVEIEVPKGRELLDRRHRGTGVRRDPRRLRRGLDRGRPHLVPRRRELLRRDVADRRAAADGRRRRAARRCG